MLVPAAIFVLSAFLALTACMKDDYATEATFHLPEEGVFVVNEGNFMYGNASLSFYDPNNKEIHNNLFYQANGIPLGDVAQSMRIYNGLGYMVVNNSSKIYVIDPRTGLLKGKVTGLTSPRYLHFVSPSKAYVTDLYAKAITIFNPSTFEVTGQISVDNGNKTFYQHSTEQLVRYGELLFVNCWSYDNKILVLDTRTDRIVDSIEVVKQPNSMQMDKNGKLWVLSDGGYQGSPYGQEPAALQKIDAESRTVEQVFPLGGTAHPSELGINRTGDTLYFINEGIWRMPVTASSLPSEPFISHQRGGARENLFYALGIHPESSEIYVADAIDYLQSGVVYCYSPDGSLLDTVIAGIIPGSFCFAVP